MKPFGLSLLGAASASLLAFAAAPAVHAQAVDAAASVGDHGNWTLKERETWLDSWTKRATTARSITMSSSASATT